MIPIKDLGMKFPKENSRDRIRYGLYICPFCENKFEARIYSEKNKKEINGCSKCIGKKPKHKTHGDSYTRLYSIYKNMHTRCYNKNTNNYHRYGGRGIKICALWHKYEPFAKWAKNNGYKESLTIDRKDNNGIYEPLNCRWIDKKLQAQNTIILRSTNTSGYRGVSFDKSHNKWKASIRFNGKTKNIGRYDTAIEAAKAYNNFVQENNLEHNINKI